MLKTKAPAVSGIYKVTCTKNGRLYIGRSLNVQHRWKCHQYDLNRNQHRNHFLQNAWNKYGADSFTFELLEAVNPIFAELRLREQYYIDLLKPTFNISKYSGGGGGPQSEDTRQMIRVKARRRWLHNKCEKNRQWNDQLNNYRW